MLSIFYDYDNDVLYLFDLIIRDTHKDIVKKKNQVDLAILDKQTALELIERDRLTALKERIVGLKKRVPKERKKEEGKEKDKQEEKEVEGEKEVEKEKGREEKREEEEEEEVVVVPALDDDKWIAFSPSKPFIHGSKVSVQVGPDVSLSSIFYLLSYL